MANTQLFASTTPRSPKFLTTSLKQRRTRQGRNYSSAFIYTAILAYSISHQVSDVPFLIKNTQFVCSEVPCLHLRHVLIVYSLLGDLTVSSNFLM